MTSAIGRQPYDTFISYRTTHAGWVETLAHNLKAQGYAIFLDRWELIPGQLFPAQIHQALRTSCCAILVASPDASDSGWVQQELQLMITLQNSGSGFFYVPIVIGEFPDLPFLETVQAVDFGDSSPQVYRQAFQRLLCGLKQQPPGPNPTFTGELRLPQIDTADRRLLVQSERTFLEAVFVGPETGRPLMILAQEEINTPIYGRGLRRHAETLYGEDNVFHGLSNEVLVPRLWSALALSRGAGLEEIAAHMAHMDRRFLFLIDEADKFVRHEPENAYRTMEALRRMSEEGHCNFILAGFWELYEQAVLDYRSPLKNLAEIIQLGALEADACRELARKPMQTMRLEYADAALIEQLLATAEQRANLMAIACHEIPAQLGPDQRMITSEDVQWSLHSERIFEALKGWDAMTDDTEACQWDRLVVYSTIDQEPFDFAELVARLRQHGLTPDGRAIEHRLARLELGFVLGRNAQERYVYRVPLFRQLILRDAPSAKLQVEVESWKSSRMHSGLP